MLVEIDSAKACCVLPQTSAALEFKGVAYIIVPMLTRHMHAYTVASHYMHAADAVQNA